MKNLKSKLIKMCESIIAYTYTQSARRVVMIGIVVVVGTLIIGTAAHALDIPIFDVFGALQKFIIWVLMSVLKFIVNLLYTVIDLLISFLGYNNFTRETPVIQGWIYVRNIANMFFSIMMLIIVYGTIFGKGPNYQTLPKLLLMAILVNFSKTITGFMIDISQVPTLTFLIAFKASATANFTQGLAIDKYVSLSGSWLADNPQGIDFSNIFVSLILGLVIAGFALMIVSMMTIMTLIRIIVFWIMIVLSPIAFVGRGIDLIKSQTWDMWMGEMKKWLIYGPVMSFFLWLSMMMMVNPDATTASFSKPSASSSVWAGDIGNFDYFIRVVLTLGMLYGALYAAQKLGGSVGGSLAGKVKKFGMTALKVGGAAVTVGAIGAALKGTSLGLAGTSSFLRKNKYATEGIANLFGKMSRITRATGNIGTGLVTEKGRKEVMTTAKTYTKGKWSDVKNKAQIAYDEATLGKGMSYVKPKSADEKMTMEKLRMETLKAKGFSVRDLSKDKKWIDETLKEQKELEKKGEKLSGPKAKELGRVQARAIDNLSKETWDDFHETFGLDSMIAAYEEKNQKKFDRDETGRIDKSKEDFRVAMSETILPDMFSKHKIDVGRQGEVLGVFDNVVKDPFIKKIGGVIKSDFSVQKAVSAADDFRSAANNEFGEGASDALKTEGDFKDAGVKMGKSKGEAADKFSRQMINIEGSNGAYDIYAERALSQGKDTMKNTFGTIVQNPADRAFIVNKVQSMIRDGKDDKEIKQMMLDDHKIDLTDNNLKGLKSFLKNNHVLNEDGFKDLYKKQSDMKKQFYDKDTVDMIGKLDALEKIDKNNIANQIEILENEKTSMEKTIEDMQRNGKKILDGKTVNDLKKLIESRLLLIDQLKKKNISKDFEGGTIENMNRKSMGELSISKNDQDFVINDDFRVRLPGSIKLFFDDDIDAGSAGKTLSIDDVNKLIQKLETKQKELKTKLLEGSGKTTTTDQESFIKDVFDKYNVMTGDVGETKEKLDSALKQIKFKEETIRQQLAVLAKAKTESTGNNTVIGIGDTKKVPGVYDFAINKIQSLMRSNAVTGKDIIANKKVNNIDASMVSDLNKFRTEFNAISKDSLAGMSDNNVAKLLYAIETGTHDLSKLKLSQGHKALVEKIKEALAKSGAQLTKKDEIKNLLKS